MSRLSFEIGSIVLLNGRRHRIVRIVNGELFTLEDVESLMLQQFQREELLSKYASQDLHADPLTPASSEITAPVRKPGIVPFSALPFHLQQIALRRKRYLDALESFGKPNWTPAVMSERIARISSMLGDSSPPSSITLYRWHRHYTNSNQDPHSLLPAKHQQRKDGCRFPLPIQEALSELIETRFLEGVGCSIIDLHDALRFKVDALNRFRKPAELLPLPSYHTVRRAVLAISQYEKSCARNGKEYADNEFRTSLTAPKSKYILEQVEIDHTPLDLFVVDDNTWLPLGRPWLTLAIDHYSRMVLGFYLSFSPPSVESVFGCLRHAVLPKENLRKCYPRVEHDWPCFGLPDTLICDNGLEFHSQSLEQAAFELAIYLQFCPKKKPYFKGRVERMLGSVTNQFAHAQPGTSFASWLERHGYDPVKEAVATFDELLHALHIWIVDIYAHTYHRGLKTTPYAKWRDSQSLTPIELPERSRLDIALSHAAERVLGHYGVELHGLRYNSRSLFPIRHRHGTRVKVMVRYSVEDLGQIHVIDPDSGEAIAVLAIEFEYANGLRLAQHKLIQQDLKENGKAETDPSGLATSKERLRTTIGEAFRSKKLGKRKWAAQKAGIHSNTHATQVERQDNEQPPPPEPGLQFTPRLLPTWFKPDDQEGGK
ncbi:transposase family protein [Laribacter hongkongensis]|uniref:transposase family protein n=1 Tax=Laribacter hongkongensis TaxID=168471 RepID=UPI001EFC39CA|nr:transposase family protein [Laribacter hongkongensis]MCG8996079.1 transposase family protein [Laribacter hongkongensis]MCG9010992.1 transposase family protein [Laribacter hongkongensis]MCG9023434.1 transposase family protein [Laribacter hongkongensis]MCG9047806.1 transposase family protein [Laribacter hongkongensis]MCG9074832.1 transposase family protein [Laribacter hongkongensis]